MGRSVRRSADGVCCRGDRLGGRHEQICGVVMVEIFWRIVTLLLTSAVLMGLYYVVGDIIYSVDMSIQERAVYYGMFLVIIFAGAFALDRR